MRQYVETSMQPETERRFETSRAQEDAALDIHKLSKQPHVWRQRILLLAAARWLDGVPYTSATATALDALIESQAGRRLELGRGTVWRERSVIRFVNASEAASVEAVSTEAVIESIPGAAVINRRRVTIELVDAVPRDLRSQHPPNPHAEYIDADRLELPLTIRPWRAGDRMRPLGMPGSKKVSDILTDARVPASRRRHALVVEDARGIVWLGGHRIDQRVRIVEPGMTRPALLRLLTVSRSLRHGVHFGDAPERRIFDASTTTTGFDERFTGKGHSRRYLEQHRLLPRGTLQDLPRLGRHPAARRRARAASRRRL